MCSALYARSNAAMAFGIGYITISFATAMNCLPGVSRATGAAMIMCVNLTRSRMPRLKVVVSNLVGGPTVQIRAAGDTTQCGRCSLQCSSPLLDIHDGQASLPHSLAGGARRSVRAANGCRGYLHMGRCSRIEQCQ